MYMHLVTPTFKYNDVKGDSGLVAACPEKTRAPVIRVDWVRGIQHTTPGENEDCLAHLKMHKST